MTNDAQQIFEKSGAVLKGHFLLTSGLHSPVYWEKFKVLQYPEYTEQLCRMIADHFHQKKVQVVVGPTTGGVILAYEVARLLGARGIFAEREGENARSFKRGFHIDSGERVLVVDDVVTTGGSIQQTVDAVNKVEGKIVGIGILVYRADKKVDFGYPFFSCLHSKTITYKPEECPLCAKKVPLAKPGSSQKPQG
jgi:orotate phosphoribosyltransferase